MRLFRPTEIVASGHSIAQLLQAARDNLRALSGTLQLRAHPELSCTECHARDGFDAARALVVHHLVEDPCGLLLLLPSRDRLWLIPASEPLALERALGLREPAAALARQQSRPISAEIFWQFQGELTHLPVGPGPQGLTYLDLPEALGG